MGMGTWAGGQTDMTKLFAISRTRLKVTLRRQQWNMQVGAKAALVMLGV